jgi:hypothetical protein
VRPFSDIQTGSIALRTANTRHIRPRFPSSLIDGTTLRSTPSVKPPFPLGARSSFSRLYFASPATSHPTSHRLISPSPNCYHGTSVPVYARTPLSRPARARRATPYILSAPARFSPTWRVRSGGLCRGSSTFEIHDEQGRAKALTTNQVCRQREIDPCCSDCLTRHYTYYSIVRRIA